MFGAARESIKRVGFMSWNTVKLNKIFHDFNPTKAIFINRGRWNIENIDNNSHKSNGVQFVKAKET